MIRTEDDLEDQDNSGQKSYREKILFVCSRNKWRSLTAEKMYETCSNYDVRSVGTEDQARVKITAGHVGWADHIFVMEKKHLEVIKRRYSELLPGKTVHCLHIKDVYTFMDPTLISVLKSRLGQYIQVPE